MEGENNIELSHPIHRMMEMADCDQVERYLNDIDLRFQRGYVEQLFLELCNQFQITSDFENCFQYLLL